MADFDSAVMVILSHEGGYVCNPKDPGGETKYGIAKRYHPDEDIYNLTIERAKDIYYAEYWRPLNLDDRSQAIALMVFDAAVNQGVPFAQRLLDTCDTLDAMHEQRSLRYRANRNFATFGRGWLARLDKTWHICQSLQ